MAGKITKAELELLIADLSPGQKFHIRTQFWLEEQRAKTAEEEKPRQLGQGGAAKGGGE